MSVLSKTIPGVFDEKIEGEPQELSNTQIVSDD